MARTAVHVSRTKGTEKIRRDKENKAAKSKALDTKSKERKKRRMKWPQRARNEILKLCRKTGPMFPRATMLRIIADSARDATTMLGVPSDFRFRGTAIEALREAAETFLNDKLVVADKWANHAKRVTLFAGPDGDLRRALEADPTFDMHRFDEVMDDFKHQRRAAKKEAKQAAADEASVAEPTVVVGH